VLGQKFTLPSLVGERAEVYIAPKRGEVKLRTASSQDVWRRARLARRVCRRLRRTDDGESTTILQASGRGSLLRLGRSPAMPATDRRRWRGTAPACKQPTVW